MIQPGKEQAGKLAACGQYDILPVSMTLYGDETTPIQVLRRLKAVSRHCCLLESMEDSRNRGRYTFLCFDPKMEISCRNGQTTIKNGSGITIETAHPRDILRQVLAEYRSPVLEGFPPFTGGLVGYFSYEYMKYSEPALKPLLQQEDAEQTPFKDVDLMLFDKVIVFDSYRQKLILLVNIRCDSFDTEYNRAQMELQNLKELILNGPLQERRPGRLMSALTPVCDESSYCRMVEKAKEAITVGDIFQVVLSNRLTAEYEGSLLDTYRVLRTTNPSPYMFYFSSDDLELAGASPETLVKLENGVLHTFPLAGTRPRGGSQEEDLRLEQELKQDEKECAEHNMLVDLGRNDLGKISEFASVCVDKYMSVERFSHVMHLGSSVSGQLRKGLDALDAVDSVLPAGTLSGAPKIRACQIIRQLEGRSRGIYGGAIGYLDFTGNMDTCIAIRFAYKKDGKVSVCSGAGIVADSVPEMEYRECMNKARAVVVALETAQEECNP